MEPLEFGATLIFLGFGFLMFAGSQGGPDRNKGSTRLGTRGSTFTPLGYCVIGVGLLLIFVGRLAMGIPPGLRLFFLIAYPVVVAGWVFFFWFRSRNRKT
jgi:hypothetical protein